MNEKMRRDEPRFDMIRQAIVKDLCKIGSPQGTGDTYSGLLDEMDKFTKCPCPLCLETARAAAEAIVVIEEMTKIVPEESEAGAAALIHKMHSSRSKRFEDNILGLVKAFVDGPEGPHMGSTVIDSNDLPPEVKEQLLKIVKDHLEEEK